MLKKALSIIVLGIVVITVLYLASANTAQVAFRLSPQKEIASSLGVLAITCFAIGALFAAIVASFFSVRAYIRERQLIWRDKRSQKFWKQIQKARGYTATEDLKRAKDMWGDMLSSDPSNSIAKIELARALDKDGQSEEALKLLDEARAFDKNNLEVLRLAYDINLKLGNPTVALDNLALIVQAHPTQKVVELARDLAEQIGRANEALKYHELLYSLGAKSADYNAIKARLEFRLLAENLPQDNEAQYKAVKNFTKKHLTPQAFIKLAELEKERGNISASATSLVEAGKLSGDSEYWYEAAKLLLRNNMPDNALSTARALTHSSTGQDRLRAELDLIRLHVALGQLDEAETLVDNFASLAKNEEQNVNDETALNVLILKGLILNRQGKYREAADIWRKLSKNEFDISEPLRLVPANDLSEAPAPRLSTP